MELDDPMISMVLGSVIGRDGNVLLVESGMISVVIDCVESSQNYPYKTIILTRRNIISLQKFLKDELDKLTQEVEE